MLTKYIIAVVFLTVIFASQETNATTPVIEQKLLLPKLIKKANEEIKKLSDLVLGIIDTQIKNIQNIKNGIEQKIKDSIEDTRTAIENIVNEAFEKIEEIADTALQAGVDITMCYVGNFGRLRRMPAKLILNHVSCVTKQAAVLNEVIQEILEDFAKDINIIADFPVEVKNCLRNPIKVIKCVTDVIEEITVHQKDMPARILKNIENLETFLTEFDERVFECRLDVLRAALEESKEIVENIMGCAWNLIRPEKPEKPEELEIPEGLEPKA